MCTTLLSINPEHVENILNGSKKFEYRRVIPREKVDKIVIYCTAPVMKIVAEVTVEDTISDTKTKLWERTRKHSGISRDFFRKYFDAYRPAHAFKLGKVTVYDEPKSLADFGVKAPPQSFIYIEEGRNLTAAGE